MSKLAPLNLNAWVEEHRHLLQPPVGNACIWNGGFLVMVVGGPNRRANYHHVNPSEELFYQLQGDIVLRVMEDGQPCEIPIRQGDIFLLPPRVPHSPQRPANTVGLVVEQPRASQEPHHLRWYCPKCQAVVHDTQFQPADIGKQIKKALEQFESATELRTCSACGNVHPA